MYKHNCQFCDYDICEMCLAKKFDLPLPKVEPKIETPK